MARRHESAELGRPAAADAGVAAIERLASEHTFRWRAARFRRAMLRNRTTWFGVSIVLVLCAMAIFAPVVSPYPPVEPHPLDRLKPPSAQYPLGTDDIGRDILSRMIYGARVSLVVGAISIGIALAAGVPLGLVAGYYGGMADAIVTRILDGLLAFPAIVLAIALMAVFGPSLYNAMIAIGIIYVPAFSRITRANVLSLREKEFVEAVRAMGARDGHILFKSILPNCLSPIIVQASLAVGYAVLVEASLSFLGLGIQPPDPSWGSMLSQGRNFISQAWWFATFPGLAIFLTVLGLNFIGDGLREALDPRLRLI
jgi:ABC-type dipeptide/oligopeptide/nickel transport system permease subunit